MDTMKTGALTAEQVATITDLLATNRQHLEEMEGQLEWERRTLTSTPFVVGFPQHGIYISLTERRDGMMDKVATCGILYANRFSEQAATRITKGGNIRNGNGETAVPVGFLDALSAQVERQRELVATLSSYLD